MITKERITEIVQKYLEPTDMFFVDTVIRPGNIIVVEIDSDEGVGIDKCIALSRHIESFFDRDVEDFELEVGSAGLSSPYKIPRQYQKNIGKEVEVLSKGGQKLYGVLKSCDDNGFTLTVSKMVKPEGAKRKIEVQEDIDFGYNDVKYTKNQIRFK